MRKSVSVKLLFSVSFSVNSKNLFTEKMRSSRNIAFAKDLDLHTYPTNECQKRILVNSQMDTGKLVEDENFNWTILNDNRNIFEI